MEAFSRLTAAVAELSFDQLQDECDRLGLSSEGPRSALLGRLLRSVYGPVPHVDVEQPMFGDVSAQGESRRYSRDEPERGTAGGASRSQERVETGYFSRQNSRNGEIGECFGGRNQGPPPCVSFAEDARRPEEPVDLRVTGSRASRETRGEHLHSRSGDMRFPARVSRPAYGESGQTLPPPQYRDYLPAHRSATARPQTPYLPFARHPSLQTSYWARPYDDPSQVTNGPPDQSGYPLPFSRVGPTHFDPAASRFTCSGPEGPSRGETPHRNSSPMPGVSAPNFAQYQEYARVPEYASYPPASSFPGYPGGPPWAGVPGFQESGRTMGDSYGRAAAAAACQAMSQWKLSFSGARGEDADDFLVRLEEGRRFVHMSDADLLNGLPFCLSGIALQWFRTERRKWTSWSDCEKAWRRRFCFTDLQMSLRDEIMCRTQGPEEPVTDYLTVMRALFSRLSPPMGEAEQVAYAHRNLLPKFKLATAQSRMNTMDELETVMARVEGSYRSADSYRAPPPPERSLFPRLAYRGPSTAPKLSRVSFGVLDAPYERERRQASASPSRPEGGRSTPRANQRAASPHPSRTPTRAPPRSPGASPARSPAENRPRGETTCWNCDAKGHWARGCCQPKRIYCYRCGKKDVTARDEHECVGNGDGSRS